MLSDLNWRYLLSWSKVSGCIMLGYVCFVHTIRSKSHFLDMENLVQGGRVIVGIAAGKSRADWMSGIIQPSL